MKLEYKIIYPHIVAIAVIFFVNILYFLPQYQGKVLPQGDLSQVRKMASEIVAFKEKTGETSLWTNSMFGGMPTYQISAPNNGNKLVVFDRVFSLFQQPPSGFFILGGILFYISMLFLRINPWLSLVGSLFFIYSTALLLPYEAGHTSKIKAVMSSAPIIVGIVLAYRNELLKGGLLFAIGLGMNILYNHVQMSYYLALALIPLVLVYFIGALKNKTLVPFIKSSAVLLLGTLLALGASTSRLWTTLEYSSDTMRGKPILTSEVKDDNSSSQVDGLAYDYAMAWSNGWGDLISSYIPLAVGGGSGEFVSKDRPIAKKIGARKDVQLPTYHGSLPFTGGPLYLGALACFLAFFSSLIVRSKLKYGLVIATVLTLILSMGKNMAFINDLFFNYVPLFNKFRTPNSVLSVTAVFISILALLGVQEVINGQDKSKYIKPLLISAGIMGGLALFIALAGSMFFDFVGPNDDQYTQILEALRDERKHMLSSSAWRSTLIVLLGASLIWLFIKGKLSKVWMLTGIILIGAYDMIGIGTRYLNHDKFVSERTMASESTPRPVDEQITKDPDPNYRVYDATINTFNSSDASNFHKTIGGYHAAKLQRYQDMIDRHISRSNMNVLNMLNTKYFIVNGPENQPVVQPNPAASGNAWFVEDVVIVPNANAEIDSLSNFDPTSKAFIHEEFKDYIGGLNPSKDGSITLKSYAPNRLVYTSNSLSDQLAVFSEIWYGPNKGWQAYIDGKPVEHIRANYVLRAMKVPAGDHEIVFEFKPKSYELGESISLICSVFLLLCLAAYLGFQFRNKRKEG